MTSLLFLAVVFLLAATLLVLSPPEEDLEQENLSTALDKLLPQTQCGACSYLGCKPYADAISRGQADINQCSPGGEPTIRAIADLLGQTPKALNPAHKLVQTTQVAFIDETLCIGCVKCIKACPVDAIIGAAKQMHTVIADACTGCELCLPPCPVDCISMESTQDNQERWLWVKPGKAVIVRR